MKHLIFGALALAVSSVAFAATPSIDIIDHKLVDNTISAKVSAVFATNPQGTCYVTLHLADANDKKSHVYSPTKSFVCRGTDLGTHQFFVPIDKAKFPSGTIILSAVAWERKSDASGIPTRVTCTPLENTGIKIPRHNSRRSNRSDAILYWGRCAESDIPTATTVRPSNRVATDDIDHTGKPFQKSGNKTIPFASPPASASAQAAAAPVLSWDIDASGESGCEIYQIGGGCIVNVELVGIKAKVWASVFIRSEWESRRINEMFYPNRPTEIAVKQGAAVGSTKVGATYTPPNGDQVFQPLIEFGWGDGATGAMGSIDEGGAGVDVEPPIKVEPPIAFGCSNGCDHKMALVRGKDSHRLRFSATFARDANQPAPNEADIEISGLREVDFAEISKNVFLDSDGNVRAIHQWIEIAPTEAMMEGSHTLTATAMGKPSTPKESIAFDFDVKAVDIPFVCLSGAGDECVIYSNAAASVDVANGMIADGERYHHAVVDARIIAGSTTTVEMICQSEYDAGCNAPEPSQPAFAPYLKFGIECAYNHLTEETSLARGASKVHSFKSQDFNSYQKCIARSNAPFILRTTTKRNPKSD